MRPELGYAFLFLTRTPGELPFGELDAGFFQCAAELLACLWTAAEFAAFGFPDARWSGSETSERLQDRPATSQQGACRFDLPQLTVYY